MLAKYWVIYLLLIPVAAYYVTMRYIPIVSQLMISLKDYRLGAGVWSSKWVGLDNFIELFEGREFWRVLRNTIEISVLRIGAGFLPPVALAVMLFDLRGRIYRGVCQTLVYLPHFFSWVVVYSLTYGVLATSTGIVNTVIMRLGGERVEFLANPALFRALIVLIGIWKDVGWGTIIYLATLSAVDTGLFEAAVVDGAGPLRRVWSITVPSLLPTMAFVLTLSLGGILYAGGEQILLYMTTTTTGVGDVLDTWIYRHGILNMEYSLSTAMGMFQSAIGLVAVWLADRLARRFAGVGIW